MLPILYFAGKKRAIYPAIPSFERIAIFKILTTLCNRREVRVLFDDIQSDDEVEIQRKKLQTVIQKLKHYTKQLPLSQLLKEKIGIFIEPLWDQILNWKEYHTIGYNKSQFYDVHLPDSLCWTVFGTIDSRKTAQVLIKNLNVNITLRYEFACLYCLETDIIELWNQMPTHCQKSAEIEKKKTLVGCSELLRLWNRVMEGEGAPEVLFGMETEDEHLPVIQEVIAHQNKSAAEYFLAKVSYKMRRRLLYTFQHQDEGYYRFFKEHSREYFIFMFSQLNAREQAQFNGILLQLFLYWPWQDRFMEIATYLIPFLGYHDYELVLDKMIRSKIFEPDEYGYQQLFAGFWKLIPEAFKQIYVQGYGVTGLGDLLISFMRGKYQRKDIIKLIWKDTNAKERKSTIAELEKNCYSYLNFKSDIPFFNDLQVDNKDMWQKLFPLLIEITREERKKKCC